MDLRGRAHYIKSKLQSMDRYVRCPEALPFPSGNALYHEMGRPTIGPACMHACDTAAQVVTDRMMHLDAESAGVMTEDKTCESEGGDGN